MRRVVIAAALAISACTDPEATREAASAYGLSEVQPVGYAPWGCGQHDTSRTKFTALNVAGQRVEGVACSDVTPFGKATTIRIVRVLPAPAPNIMAR